jgi:hypothetical protein
MPASGCSDRIDLDADIMSAMLAHAVTADKRRPDATRCGEAVGTLPGRHRPLAYAGS